jgi:2-acylglycerol O-acyltransferase 2
MHIVIGNPIDPPKNVSEENFNDMVAVYHKQYVQALQDLYDKYKDVYAKDRTSEMVFVE